MKKITLIVILLAIVGVFVLAQFTGFSVFGTTAQNGDFVAIDYTIKVNSGATISTVYTTVQKIGDAAGFKNMTYGPQVIPLSGNSTLVEAVEGMRIGESKTFNDYSPLDRNYVFSCPIGSTYCTSVGNSSLRIPFNSNLTLSDFSVGGTVSLGSSITGTVMSPLSGNTVYLNFNNALAGYNLTYEVTLRSIWREI